MAVFPGTPGPDPLTGGIGDDLVDGLAGNDTLDGGTGGIDTLSGGDGDDLLRMRTDDVGQGGSGDDIFAIHEDTPGTLNGGSGVDTIRFEGGYDITGTTLVSVEQAYLFGSVRMTAAQLGSFQLISGYSSAYTTAAVVLTQGGTATVNLSATLTGNFSLTGSDQADILTFAPGYLSTIYAYAGGGNDRIISAGGNDSLRGDDGNDTLSGLDGADSLDGGDGVDSLLGGNGNDFIVARAFDTVNAGAGDDLVGVYESAPVVLAGAAGIDTLRFEGSYDISGATLSGFENLNLWGSASMTTAQLATFLQVQGYGAGYTSASLYLTQGGTATVNLSSALTAGFWLYGSDDAESITFNPSYVFRINFYGGLGDDVVFAAAGADSLRGDDGNDTLNGNDGNDSLDGGLGADLLNGGNGDDYMVAGTGDTVNGVGGNDTISVQGSLSAVINGGVGVDSLRFEGGYDISGSTVTGVENLNAYWGTTLTAAQLGAFKTVAGYDAGWTSTSVNLTQGGTAVVRLSATLTNYFSLNGSAQADILTFIPSFTHQINVFAGLGDDSIVAAQGADSLRGDDGNDTLSGLSGNDSLDGGAGYDSLLGGLGDDYLVARIGDSVYGGDNDDVISVQDHLPAVLDGGLGYDTLRFEGSYDISSATLIGIEQLNAYGNVRMTAAQLGGFTLVSGYGPGYTTATVYLTQGGTASVDLSPTLSQYFVLYGSAQADAITFSPADIQQIYVYAGAGDDSITAAQGNDSLRGDAGNDTLIGLGGNDTIDGGAGANLLNGGLGNDTLIARAFDKVYGAGNDDLISVSQSLPEILDGGTGLDTLRFEGSYDITGATLTGIENLNAYGIVSMTAAQLDSFTTVAGYSAAYTTAAVRLTQGGSVDVALSSTLTGSFSLTGSSEDETLSFNAAYIGQIRVDAGYGNDNVSGASGADSLRGDQGNDVLRGLNGNDTLIGGAGADTLVGGNGIDILTGGAGRDTFVFDTTGSSPVATPDQITDFEGAGAVQGDRIDLSAIDANGSIAGLGTFVFGSVAQGGLSVIDSGLDTLIRGNTDADAAFEIVIRIIDGAVLASDYTAADFVL